MRSSTFWVFSSAVPSGMSSTTWNSDLLSKGSILRITSLKYPSDPAAIIRKIMLKTSRYRLVRPHQPSFRNGPSRKPKNFRALPTSCFRCSSSAFVCLCPLTISLKASHGEMMKATARESIMPMEALIGMGLM